MNNKPKGLTDNNEEGFILNESGTSVPGGSAKKKNVTAEEGSETDPQLTELDGLKRGAIDPKSPPEEEAPVKRERDRE